MNRIRVLWLGLQASLWFVPTVVVAGCLGLALLLIEAHTWGDLELAARWPRLFGAGSDGARQMLSAIATSMITVAGVVFSVTIVAPGGFRTDFAGRSLTQSAEAIGDYAATAGKRRKENDTVHGTQPGDPAKAEAAMIALAEAENPPASIFLGSDALKAIDGVLEARASEVAVWRELSASTDF